MKRIKSIVDLIFEPKADNRVWKRGEVPFSEHGDASDLKKTNLRHRLNIFRSFIPFDISKCHSLDMGANNTFGNELGLKDNTFDTDLNVSLEAPSKDYDLIVSSDIIEHLFNPGLITQKLYSLLKPGGYLLLGTPHGKWMIPYECWYHFTEYKPKCLKQMFEYYGFEIVNFRTYSIWDWEFIFWGIRPFFRVLFHRNQLWLLRRPINP
jgi:SAM-dependent methyltransferase